MATLYISPTGSGNGSGSSFANAAKLTSLDSMIAKAGPGGQVLLLADAGSYATNSQINIAHGGTAAQSVTVRGVDSSGHDMEAVINGTRPNIYAGDTTAGNELFRLLGGANNLTFSNLDIQNVGTAFRAGADLSNITIEHVNAQNVARFFQDLASGSAKTANISHLTIHDVDVTGFSKAAIQLEYDTHGVVFDGIHADSGGQVGDPYVVGIHLDGTVHDVLIENSSVANARSVGSQASYWNGDGFSTEKGVYGVTIKDSSAIGNTDAGFDIKSSSTMLIGVESADNGRNFRFWSNTTLENSIGISPHVRGGSSSQAQVAIDSGASAKIINSTFVDSDDATKVFTGSGGTISFTNDFVTHSTASMVNGLYHSSVQGSDQIHETSVASGSIITHSYLDDIINSHHLSNSFLW